MRALVINAQAKEKVEATLTYARHHEYDLAQPLISAPGDDPGHVVNLDSYRCVFSFTREKSVGRKLYRHLSVSVPSEGFPHPVAIAAIAGLFGFSGAEEGLEARLGAGAWIVNVNTSEHCIVLAEIMTEK